MSPGIVAFVDTPPGSCGLPPGHALEPSARPCFALARVAGHARRRLIALAPAAPGRSIRNPQSVQARHRSGHRTQPCAMKTVMTRPSPGWTAIEYSFLGPKSIHEKQKYDHESVNTLPVVAGLDPAMTKQRKPRIMRHVTYS